MPKFTAHTAAGHILGPYDAAGQQLGLRHGISGDAARNITLTPVARAPDLLSRLGSSLTASKSFFSFFDVTVLLESMHVSVALLRSTGWRSWDA